MRIKALILASAMAFGLAQSLAAVPAPVDAPRTSADLARELVSVLTTLKLDAIAAPDPADPGRVVAALSFPGVQLLVMSARHKSFDYLSAKIAKRQFHDVYEALQTGVPETTLFFHDIGCDGFTPGENVDIFYEGPTARTMFDGNWDAQGLTEAEYAEKLKQAEQKYAHALTVLIEAAKKIST